MADNIIVVTKSNPTVTVYPANLYPPGPNAVGTSQIQDNSVTDAKIQGVAAAKVAYGGTTVQAQLDNISSNGAGKGANLVGYDADESVQQRLDNIAASGGSSLVGFAQPGTGAAPQTLQAKARQYISLADYTGWDGTGTADSSTAFTNAVADAIATGVRRVRVPAGITRLASKVTIALTGISGIALEGEGASLSKILVDTTTGDGIEITRAAGNWWLDVVGGNQNAIRIADLTVMANALNIGTGIKINGGSTAGRPGAPINFHNVAVRAYNSINNQAFLIGVHLYNCGGATFDSCNFFVGGTTNLTPTTVKLECDTVGSDFSGIFFNACGFTYGNLGVSIGDRIEGVYFTNCAFVGMNTAVNWTATSESGFHFIGGHVNTANENFILSGVYDFVIQGALLYGPSNGSKSNISVTGGGRQTISGCVVYGRAGSATGISVSGGASGTQAGLTINGNTFVNLSVAISLSSTSNYVHVGVNGYESCGSRVVNNSTSSFVYKQSYSVSTAPSLTGGATSENINIAIPSGLFLAKPTVAVCTAEGSSADYIATYNSSTSSATSMQFRVVRRDGAVLGAGAARFNIVAFE